MSLYNEQVTMNWLLSCCADCTPEFCNPSEVKGSWGRCCLSRWNVEMEKHIAACAPGGIRFS